MPTARQQRALVAFTPGTSAAAVADGWSWACSGVDTVSSVTQGASVDSTPVPAENAPSTQRSPMKRTYVLLAVALPVAVSLLCGTTLMRALAAPASPPKAPERKPVAAPSARLAYRAKGPLAIPEYFRNAY